MFIQLLHAIHVYTFLGVSTSTPFCHGGGPVTHDGSYMADFSRLPSAIKTSTTKPKAFSSSVKTVGS